MGFVLSLALAQLWHHRGRWALMAIGVALVVAVPVVTEGLSRSVGAQTVRHTVAGLDVSDRTLLISQELDGRFRVGTAKQNDVEVRRELARLTSTPALRELLFRPLRVQGSLFSLGGVDGLARDVRMTSGRFPRTCTPARCEVIVVGGGDSAALRDALTTLGVVVVGHADRTDPLLISGVLDTSGAPVVLADGADPVGDLTSMELFGRHYVWAAPVDPDRVIAVGVPAYVRAGDVVEQTVFDKVGSTTFTRPDDQLLAAQHRADVSAQRFGLLGGFAAVLLLGFAVVAAIGLRREAALLQSVLRRRGATSTQVVVLHAGEAVAVTVAGAGLGAVLGGVAAGFVNDGTGLSAPSAAAHAAGAATLTGGLLTLATAVVVVAVLLWPDAQSRAVWRLLDFLAAACLGAALLAGDRGTSRSVSGDPLVVALPVLVSIVAGLVAGRLWSPAARLAERLVPRRSVAGRIGLLGALRRPLRPVATVAFLTAAVAAVIFAGAYRATLLANDADQAAYRVPLDETVSRTDTGALPVLDPTSLGPRARAYAVLRGSVSVDQLAGVVQSVPMLAVDRDVLPRMHRWDRTTGSSDDAASVATKLQVPTPAGAPTLPAGTRTVSIDAVGADPQTTLELYLRTGDGRSVAVILTGRGDTLVGTVPASGRLTVAAFSVDESPDYATHHGHGVGEGPSDRQLLSGQVNLGAVHADGAVVPWSWATWGSLLGRSSASASRLVLGYQINGAPIVATPSYQAKRAIAVPVITDAATAALAQDGMLALHLDLQTTVTARVVATMPRLPTVGTSFVLADRTALANAVDVYTPGTNATEYWVSGTITAHIPYSVSYRTRIQADLDADPVGRGARLLLIIVAVLALAVAAVALVLLVVGERRDGAGELYAWEADGARPAVLRRALAVRAVAATAVAVPVGIVAGLVVARVGAALVAVDASGTTPTPPLQVTLGSVWTPLVLLAGVGAGLLGGLGVALRSLRERFPVAAEADLR